MSFSSSCSSDAWRGIEMGSRDGSHGRCDGDGGDDDLAELSRLLKLERMFVTCERAQLRSLHEEVVRAASRLHRVAWITRHQRLSVRRLMHADADSTPHECCARINTLELVDFVDGYRRLSYHESKVRRMQRPNGEDCEDWTRLPCRYIITKVFVNESNYKFCLTTRLL